MVADRGALLGLRRPLDRSRIQMAEPEERWRADAEARLASLAKPPGALGTLEDWCVTLCVAQKTLRPTVSAAALVFCGDHGCKKADAALSPYPASATQAIFRSLAAGVSCAAVLARSVGATLHVVDVGIDGDVSDVRDRDGILVHRCKVLPGTSDLRVAPAMTEPALDAALRVGRQRVRVVSCGATVICVGEVGIGNTTAAACLLAALTGNGAETVCGRGTGLDDAGLAHKIETVRVALAHHNLPTPYVSHSDARNALRCVGGLEIAAMVGAYMAMPATNAVAVVDGFISGVAALCATRMEPACRSRMIFATSLAEEPSRPGGGAILAEAVGANPALDMGLRLGECSAAVLALPLLSAAAALPNAATLAEAMALSPHAPTPAAAADDDDDGFVCLGSVTAEERAAAARRAAEAAGNVLEVESPPRPVAAHRRSFASDADATFLPVPRSPRTPVEGALPPVPTFMGRGTARRPVEPPAPAPSFGARANYDPVLDE